MLKNEVLMQERIVTFKKTSGQIYLIKYFYQPFGILVKVWRAVECWGVDGFSIKYENENTQEIQKEIDPENPYLTFDLDIVNDFVRYYTSEDMFETKQLMLNSFDLYKYISDSIPWDNGWYTEEKLIEYCSKTYNFDISSYL